jgi:hypothetical protein
MGSGGFKVFVLFIFLTYYLHICYRPVNKEELFNLRHASARNVIERIFGVLKRRFRILLIAPEYNLEIQARIPAALCTIHNFIRTHEADDPVTEPDRLDDNVPDDHDHNASAVAAVELDRPLPKRDEIAQQMWDDYMRIRNERSLGREDESGDDDDEFEGEEDKENKENKDENAANNMSS